MDSSRNYGFGESEEFSMMMLIHKNLTTMAKLNHVRHRDECDRLDTIICGINKENQFLAQLWEDGNKLLNKPNMIEPEEPKED